MEGGGEEVGDSYGSEAASSGYMPISSSEPSNLLMGPWKDLGLAKFLVLDSTLGIQANISVFQEPCTEGKIEIPSRFLGMHTGTQLACQWVREGFPGEEYSCGT